MCIQLCVCVLCPVWHSLRRARDTILCKLKQDERQTYIVMWKSARDINVTVYMYADINIDMPVPTTGTDR